MSIIAIGEECSIEVYKIIGAKTFCISKINNNTINTLLKLLEKGNVIIIEESLYKKIKSSLKGLRSFKRENIFIVVPSIGRRETERLKELNEILSLAMGVELKWVR